MKQQLENLSQQQAAWLIGRRPSWLRNRPDAPRGDDGKYSARDLVAWALADAATEPATLTEVDSDRASVLADLLIGRLAELDGCAIAEVAAFIGDVADRYGPGGLAALMAAVHIAVDGLADIVGPPRRDTEREIRERHERQIDAELAAIDRSIFDEGDQ